MEDRALPAQESSVLRYYTSALMLRVLATDALDPQGASFTSGSSTAATDAPFLSIAESHMVAPLLRAPSVVVVSPPPTETNANKSNKSNKTNDMTRGVFTVLPAEGFVKQRGEPVYYNEPIQLVDQRGRVLGIAPRAPCAGHVAADGHSGAVVLVLARTTSRQQSIGDKFILQHNRRRSMSGTSSSDGASTAASDETVCPITNASSSSGAPTPRRASLVHVCGGDHLRIPGLVRVVKKQYPHGCIMQPKLVDAGEHEPPSLLCEVVLTSTPPSSSVQPASQPQQPQLSAADRTATGDFVGVLHTGILHRRSEHMKLWKKRFFVLTQVALHRFDAHETLDSIRTRKTRESISLKDCRSVRYERFARPHELELELVNGKVLALHSVDALTCSEWASVLSRAMENPHWVHAERSCLTVWRSDAQYESPQCPAITKVVLRRTPHKYCGEPRVVTVTNAPQWNEKLSLGSISATGFVRVHLSDGNEFRLTLDDLSRSLVQPRWLAVSTSLEVARIQAMDDDDDDDVPQSVTHERGLRKSLAMDDSSNQSRFLVRLQFQADLQLDQRLRVRRSLETEKRLVCGVLSGLVVVPAVVYGCYPSLNALGRSLCLVSATLVATALVALAPVAWQLYLWMRYGDSMEGELHWFLTLLALEVRPHNDEIADRKSTSSGEDNRLRLSTFLPTDGDADDETNADDATIVVPTKTPLYGDETPQLAGQSPAARASRQAIRAFRLENALDSILARPLLSFFAIKQFFPSQFLPRDAQGHRVLLVSLNQMNRHGLAHHNVSGFNIVRYFLYLWEFMWSYQDLQEGVAHSQLVMVVDCSGWPYFKWFSIECQVLLLLLNTTYRFYPDRLARVVFVRNHMSFGVYGRLVGKVLDPGLRALIETCDTMPPSVLQAIGTTPSQDETALHEFVTKVLAAHANVAIPSFTRRELEQATRFTTTGSLHVDDRDSSLDAIGTLAVVVPTRVDAIAWERIVDGNGFTMWKSTDPTVPQSSIKGTTYQSDARAAQWRGQYTMKTSNADHVIKALQEPQAASVWMEDTEQLVVLDTLSAQEDLCFWSRRVPFMNFSLSGHRDENGSTTNLSHVPMNAFFHCVMRRIQEIKPGRDPHDRIATVMWKTPSAQHFVVDRPSTPSDKHQRQRVHWRKLEDPFVSLCYVVEEQAASKSVTLRFWFQSFSPPTTATQDAEIAHLLQRKLNALDATARQEQEKEIQPL